MGEQRLRGVIQERRRLLREGLALWIAAQHDLELVATAGTGPDLVAACEGGPIDFVMLEADVSEWDPIETAHEVRRRHPAVRLVGTAHDWEAARALVAAQVGTGPCEVVSRAAGIGEILAAVRGGAAVTTVRAPATDPRLLLTDRQLEVLVSVGMGLSAREIALRLGISAKTVDNHKQRIYARLDVQNQAHAVAVAMRAGLIPAPGGASGGFAS